LADELLKLADPDVACLNEDGAAALDLLARHVPAVAEIARLADLPRRPANALVEQRASWAWEIPGRKRQQIEAFASASQCGAGSVIDWCGGKGHLGRLLAAQWQVPVHTLEIDAALCAEGAALANRQRLSHEFLNINALTAADWPKRGQHAVALHACGDLHRRLIAQGANVGVARFDVAPCCYYRGVASTYQALSGNLRTALTRDDVRLAVTETVTASARLTVQRDKEMAWKLGFDTLRRALTGEANYRSFKNQCRPPGFVMTLWVLRDRWRNGKDWQSLPKLLWPSLSKPAGGASVKSCAFPSFAMPFAAHWRSGWCLIWRFFLKGRATTCNWAVFVHAN
jgi:hypothetical protein